jgi:hypothetical protein
MGLVLLLRLLLHQQQQKVIKADSISSMQVETEGAATGLTRSRVMKQLSIRWCYRQHQGVTSQTSLMCCS